MVCSLLDTNDTASYRLRGTSSQSSKKQQTAFVGPAHLEFVWTKSADGAIKVTMGTSRGISRRKFVRETSLAAAGAATYYHLGFPTAAALSPDLEPLKEFGYGDVKLTSDLHEKQLHETHAVLMELSEDSLLKPFRQMAGQPAPGADLGGWYHYDPDYDPNTVDVGFAPGATFGQWVSALARSYAIDGSPATREKVLRLNRLYAQTISGDFYEKNRFPAYCYDKLVCGLIDSHQYVHD